MNPVAPVTNSMAETITNAAAEVYDRARGEASSARALGARQVYIIIVGAGEVGSYLARILVEEQHDVAIIERDDNVARQLEGSLDALVVQGNGVSHSALRQAGIKQADLVIAATEVDEVNIIACMTAMKLGNQPMTVARIRDVEYLGGASLAEDLGLSLLVGPERAVANKVVDLLAYEGAGEHRQLAGGRVSLLELPLSPDSPLVHEPLAELRDVLPSSALIVAALGPRGLRIPRGGDQLAADERAYVLTTPDCINEFMILSGKPWHHVRHVLIIGCGNIGFHLAKELEDRRLYPTIIEQDHQRAAWVAKHLKKSIVLEGDGTDPQLLREQMEDAADAVVVLLEDDEKSVLVGLFAKHLGARKVIVRSDKLAYAPIAHQIGIDSLISPQRAVANAILRFVRRGRIASSHMLGDHEAEIIELKVTLRSASVLDKPLHQVEFPHGSLVGAVIRDDRAIIATGDTVLRAGDDLLVVTTPGAVHQVEKLFE
jgi:trk system potassium uptake protein TrkA